MIVNHVMSNDVQSSIFNSILSYFNKYTDNDVKIVTSIAPIDGADVYHYHRPNLEKNIQKNSVITVHHDLNDNDEWLSIEKFIPKYKQAKKIICLNTLQKGLLHQYGIDNTVVIPHGVNRDIFKYIERPLKEGKDRKNILITSKRYPRKVKGEAYLYELLRYLDVDKIHFVLVGENRSLDVDYFVKYGCSVEWHEYVPYRMFGNLYHSADFLLMCSYYEGGPANIPEAVASGLPIICNPIGMAKDFVDDMDNGIYLTMDPKKDAETINSYLGDQYRELKQKAEKEETRSRAIGWDEVVFRNIEIYREIAK